MFQVINVGPKTAQYRAKIKRIATVYRKVVTAAKAQRLALKSSTLNPIVQINMHSAGYALHSLFSTGPR
ncbi:hypothetical protein HV356_06360 [Citrobacter sp. RHBSTW-01065]|nr:hypothetical protein [Citrobacter sp. RHBSTW-01065]